MDNQFKVIYWNCQGALPSYPDINSLLNDGDVCLLSETLLSPKKKLHFKDFRTFRIDSDTNRRGLAIIIKNDLSFSIIPNTPNFPEALEIMGISIDLPHMNINIFNVYRSPSASFQVDSINALSTFLKNFQNVIICGDFNLHNPLWGANRSFTNSTHFIDKMYDANLVLLNDGSHTYFSHSGAYSSCLDLSFVSTNLAPISSHAVHTDSFGSDHCPSTISIATLGSRNPQCRNLYPLLHVDWKTFQEKITDDSSIVHLAQLRDFTHPDPSLMYEEFISALDFAIVQAIHPNKRNKFMNRNSPSRPRKRRSTPAVWWDESCQHAKEERSSTEKQYRSFPSMENKILRNKARAVARKTFNRAKRHSFHNLVCSIGPQTPLRKVWKTFAKFTNRSAPHENFTNNLDCQEAIQSIKDRISSPPPNPILFPSNKFQALQVDNASQYNRPFTLEELNYTIHSSRPNTSPGLDRINNTILKKLPKIA